MAETINLGIVGIKNMGEYNSETEYEKLNVVTYQGSTYCALRDTVNNLPTNTNYWQLYAEKGEKGDTGLKGDTGDVGPKGQPGDPGGRPLVASSVSEMTDTTSVYVNTTDGYWYYYDGTSWVQGGIYQSTGIADGSITPSLTSFYNLNSLIPYDGWITGSVYYENDGHLGAYTQTSAYNPKQVPITPNTKLIYHNEKGINGLRVHYFNGDTYISSNQITNNATSVLTTPANTTNLRFSSYNVALTTLNSKIYLIPLETYLQYTNTKNAIIKNEYFNDISSDDILITNNKVKIIDKVFDRDKYTSYTTSINNNRIDFNGQLRTDRTSTSYPGFYAILKNISVGDKITIKTNLHKQINMFQGKLNNYNSSSSVGAFNMTNVEEYTFTITQNMIDWLNADTNNCFIFNHNTPVDQVNDNYYFEFVTKNGRTLTDFINDSKDGKEYKALFLGDSITALTGTRAWWSYFNNILNITAYNNVAVNGARLRDYPDTIYDGNPTNPSNNNVLGNQVQKIINNQASYVNPDFIFIAIGTNDGIVASVEDGYNAYYNSQGELIDLSNVDRTTYAGAFRYCNEKLHELYPNAKIIWFTPIQAFNGIRNVKNTILWGDSLKNLCSVSSTYCVDSEKCGINGVNELRNANGEYLDDGLHPNANGAKVLGTFNASEVKKFI